MRALRRPAAALAPVCCTFGRATRAANRLLSCANASRDSFLILGSDSVDFGSLSFDSVDFGSFSFGWAIHLLLLTYLGTSTSAGATWRRSADTSRSAFVLYDESRPEQGTGCAFVKHLQPDNLW